MLKLLARTSLAVALIASVLPTFSASGAAGPPSLSVDTPAPNTRNVGDTFTVQVNISTNGQPITGWQFGFTYDPTVIELQGSSGAQAVGSNLPRTVFGTFLEDNLPPNGSVGGVSFKLIGSVGTTANVQPGGRVLTGQDANTGSNGSGKLASFTFKALANGTSPFTLTSAKVTDVTAGAISGVTISPANPSVVIGAAPAPDTATPTMTPTPTLPPTPGGQGNTPTPTQTPLPSPSLTPGPTATITPTTAPVCVSDSHPTLDGTSMTFSPSTPSMLVGGSAVIIVNLNTGTTQSFGMQFGLTYDPAVISVDSISAGSFYGDAITTKQWDLSTPGNIPIGGVSVLGSDTGPTGSGAVASIGVTARSLGSTTLTFTCAADSVPNSTGSANESRPLATRGTSRISVTVPPEPTTTETPTATPAPSATPKPIATVVVESKDVRAGDVFNLDVTLSNLSPGLLLRVVSFGISSSPPGIVKVTKMKHDSSGAVVTGQQPVDVGAAFSDFAAQSHGATSASVGKPFVIDSSGNVVEPGAIELTTVSGTNGGPTGGVVATIHMQALATGSADVKLLVIDNPPLGKTCPPCGTLLDHIGISTISTTDRANTRTAGAILSGGHITVGAASVATATVTLTPTATSTATAGTQTPTPTLTPTSGPSLTPNPTQTQKPRETDYPTSTPIALGNTTIGLSPARATPATGASFKVDITISGGVPIRAFQFGLLFDPKVVHVDSVDPGPVFNTWADANGASVSVIPSFDVDNTKGTVAKGGINLLGGQSSPSATGVLATITLKGVGDGTSPLTLTDLGLSVSGGILGSGAPKNDTWCIASPAQLPVDCLLKATIPINNGQVFIGAAAQATAAALTTLTPQAGVTPATAAPTPPGGVVAALTSDPNAPAASGAALATTSGQSVLVDPNTGAVVSQAGPLGVAAGSQAGPSTAAQPQSLNRPIPQVSGVQQAGPPGSASTTTQSSPAAGTVQTQAPGSLASGGVPVASTPRAGPTGGAIDTAAATAATVRAVASPTAFTFDISRAIDARGVITQEVRMASPDGTIKILIPTGTVALTRDKRPVRIIDVTPSDDLPVVPDDVLAASAAYEFGPSGATFSPPITVSLPYDPVNIPDNMAEDNVEPAFFDTNGSSWVTLGGTADPIARTVTAQVGHFTTFAVLTKRGGVNWLLFAGIVLVELGLGTLGALAIRRSRAGAVWLGLPWRGPWSRQPARRPVKTQWR